MQFRELTAAGTYVLKMGPGYFQGITVNSNAGTSPTLRIADNASNAAPYIAGGSAAFAIPTSGSFLDYDCRFSNGLTVVVGGTLTGSLTVAWY